MKDSSRSRLSPVTARISTHFHLIKKLTYIGFVPLLALPGLVGLFWLMVAPSGAAPLAVVRYAAPGGAVVGDCTDPSAPCSLQWAVDAAETGDEVRVAAGTYSGAGEAPVLLVNKTITVSGGYHATSWEHLADASLTILDGENDRRVVEITGAVSPILEYLSVRNGSAAAGAGIYNQSGSPTIRHNLIYGNETNESPDQGGGIFDGGSAIVEENKIYWNAASVGAGIYAHTGADIVIRLNEIYSNTAATRGGGILTQSGAAAFLEANTIYQNRADIGGGFYASAAVTMYSNLLYANEADGDNGAGGALVLVGDSVLWNNTLVSNTATVEGGGIYIFSGDSQISNTIVATNSAGSNGGISVAGGTVSGGYNNIFDNASSVTFDNPVDGDPLFVNPTVFNFRLQEGSPNVDAGDPDTPVDVAVDFEGQLRPFGDRHDVGADERHPDVAGFEFTPAFTSQQADRGSTAVYSHTLNNTGTLADSYTFTCSNDLGWVVTCPGDVTDLQPGLIATVSTQVAVPAGAPALTKASTVVTATSTISGTLAPQAVVIETTVKPIPGLAFTPHFSETLLPGETITFTHILTNTGDAADTITLRKASDPLDWGQLHPGDPFTTSLNPGQSRPVTVTITVPPFAAAGFANTVALQAESGFDPAITASVANTVTARATVGTRYVSTLGSDSNNNCTQPNLPCRTVARGINQASFNDAVRIAAGTYGESGLTIADTIHVSGGWTADFSSQTEDPGASVIDATSLPGPILTILPGVSIRPTISNLTFSNGSSATSGGAVFVNSGAQPTFNNVGFSDNQAATNGGALFISNSAFVTIIKGRFANNTAQQNGGAIYLTGATLSLQQSRFSGNSATGAAASQGGGALFVSSGFVSGYNNLFHENTAASVGGAVRLEAGQHNLGNNTFVANSATGDGGGVYNHSATTSIVNTIFADNTAAGSGAVHRNGGSVTMDYNLFWQNSEPASNVPLGDNSVSDDPLFADDEFRLGLRSPAIDAGDPGTILAVDFEDDFRPSDQGFDIGYDELAGCRTKRDETIYGSIQDAINANSASSLIMVSGICRGVHTIEVEGQTISQTVHLGQNLTIQGGWNGNFSQRTYEPTYVDPEGNGRGFYLSGNVTPTLEGLVIVNGNATGLGGGPGGEDAGGGVYNRDSNTILRGVAIYTGTATLGAGFYNHTGAPNFQLLKPESNAPVILNDIAGNEATRGGGVYNYNGPMSLDSSLIHGNQATEGGGVYNQQGALNASNSVIYQNSVSGNGGGIYNQAAAAGYRHLTVYSNTAAGNGGGFYNGGGSPVIRSNIFQGNQAAGGAALFVDGGTPDEDYNYYHDHNGAPVAGQSLGAHSIDSATPPGLVDPAGGDFHLADNAPAADAGDLDSPILTDFDGDPRPSNQGPDMGADELVGCLARVNNVIYGSIQVALNAARVDDQIDVAGRCSGVHAYDAGGSLGVISQTVHLTKSVTLMGGWRTDFSAQDDVTILDAEGKGRVIYVGPSITATISTFDILNGDATAAGMNGDGGAIYIDNAAPAVLNNRIYNNAAVNGGAVFSANSDGRIDGGNHIYDNSAGNGGAIYINNGLAAVQNNFIYDNTAADGGAIYHAGGNATYWHNTLYGNNADSSGGGFYIAAGSPEIRSNIVMNNMAIEGGGAFGATDATPLLRYNNFFGNSTPFGGVIASGGTGHQSVDPIFADPANGDFTLAYTSPVVDKGDPDMPLSYDFEGDIRPSHHGFDIGADEVGGCFARVLSEPGTIYGSVQQAVDAAEAGDTVEVDGLCLGVEDRTSGGTVTQGLFIDKSITVDGDWTYETPDLAIIDALQRGRTLFVAGGTTVTVTNIILQQGNAELGGLSNSGGGVYNGGTLALVNAALQESMATNGGAVYNAGDLALQGSMVMSNTATTGGGLYNDTAGQAEVGEKSAFHGNSASNGGAVYQNQGSLRLDGNRLYQNTASANGGAVYLAGGAAEVYNNFIFKNNAVTGAGLYDAGTGADIWHNTFVANAAGSGDGGGLYSASGAPSIRSNIIDSNSGAGIHTLGSATIQYNNVTNNAPNYAGSAAAGLGDISLPPDYVDAANDDYHLQDGSPGQDVGDPALPGLGLTYDYDGDLRPTNAAPDIGADEINLCLIRVGERLFGKLQDAIDYAEAEGIDTVEIARGECRGVQERDGTLQVGYVSQSLNFTGSLRRLDFSDPDDYNSDEVGAVSTIIDAEGDGRVIYVAPGAEPTFTHLAFVNGAAGDGNGGAIYHPGSGDLQLVESYLCQSTAANGGGYYGGAAASATFGGARLGLCRPARVNEGPEGETPGVQYLTFDGNEATGHGGGLYSQNGLEIGNATFHSNSAGGHGGGVYNSGHGNRLINATFYSNTAAFDGGGVYNSGDDFALYHNTIHKNTAEGNGGGVYNSGAGLVLDSSIVYTNTAAAGGGLWSVEGSLDYNIFYDNAPDNTDVAQGPNSFSADPRIIGLRTLSRFSPAIDQANPDWLDTGVPPDGFLIDTDASGVIRPDGGTPHNGLYGKNSDIGADEYWKDFGCAVEPTPQNATVNPGQTVIYTFSIVNTGHPYPPTPGVASHGYTDTIHITLNTTQGWAELEGGAAQAIELDWLESGQRVVTVTVPATATMGLQETSLVSCESGSMPGERTATGTAVTNVGLVSSVDIEPSFVDTALPGDVITYTQIITNNGNQADTFLVTPNAGAQGLTTAAIVNEVGEIVTETVTIGPSQSVTVLLQITVLDTAAAGEVATPGAVVRSTTVTTPPIPEDSVLHQISIGYIAGTRYVALGGLDTGNNCTDPIRPCATIQHAIEQALDGDTILVAAGVYTDAVTGAVGEDTLIQNVFIDKSVTIRGGYSTADDYSVAQPITNAVVLSGEGERRAIYVSDGVTVTLSSLFVRDGVAALDDSGVPLHGGGIYNAGAHLTITGTWILSNLAQFGGGLYHQAGNLTINSSVFAGNNEGAFGGIGWSGDGGSLYVASGIALLENNTFVDNRVHMGTSNQPAAVEEEGMERGGAVYQAGGELTLLNNIFSGNGGSEEGSAVYVTSTDVISSNFNLFFNQGEPFTNFDEGPDSVIGEDPEFIDEYFHIDSTSAAKDAGTSAVSMNIDFDLEERPQGLRFDIGADERTQRPDFEFMPITQTAVISAGETITFTHILTNTGDPTDSYTITWSDHLIPDGAAWETDVFPDRIEELASGESMAVTLVVTGDLPGYINTTIITATSDLGVVRSVTDTTRIYHNAGVDIEEPEAGSGLPGETITYTHSLTNTGDGVDEFLLEILDMAPPGWEVTITPTQTGFLEPEETVPFTVTVTIPANALSDTVHSVTIQASAFDPDASDTLTDTTTVLGIQGLLLEPDNEQMVADGATAIYSHTLTNQGNVTETVLLAYSADPADWAVTIQPPDEISLPAFSATTITVTVETPPDSGGQVHTVAVTATSSIDPAIMATAVNTTTVEIRHGVALTPDYTRTVTAGATIIYSHILSNTGNVTDTFNLTADSSQGWADFGDLRLTLAPGASETVDVTVNVPADAEPGDVDVTTITAISETEATVSDSAIDTTQVGTPVAGVSIDGPASGVTGASYTFTATVSPDTASLPITYTWQATDQAAITTGNGLTNTQSFTWATAGTKTITVTAENAGGAVSDVHTITITVAEVPVSSVSISGPTDGDVDIDYIFTAAVNPGNAATPIRYDWTATDQMPRSSMAGIQDHQSFRWTTPGTKLLTVTATNALGSAVASHTIEIVIPEWRLYMPVIMKAPAAPPPGETPTPTATPTASPTPTITPTPCSPTGVDLIVTEIRVEPDVPAGGQSATVYVTIRNQGSVNVAFGNNFYLDFYVDRTPTPFLIGDLAWGVQGADLTAGASKTYTATYTFSGGLRQLWAQVDTDNTVNECPFEDNNIYGPVSLVVTGQGGLANTPSPENRPAESLRHTPTPEAAGREAATPPVTATLELMATPTATVTAAPTSPPDLATPTPP